VSDLKKSREQYMNEWRETLGLEPVVTIPRPMYEALVAALQRNYELMRVSPPECTIKEWFDALDNTAAVLRAAGIETEEDKP
jgi:hypothetical protein